MWPQLLKSCIFAKKYHMEKEEYNENPGPEIKPTDKDGSDPKENTRSKIATLYVLCFFAVILLVFITGCCKNFDVDDYKDLILTVSGVLTGPLGFIVGYYFKASKE